MLRVTGLAVICLMTGFTQTTVSANAAENCSKAVVDAYAKQRKTAMFRMKTLMIGSEGPVNMTVDYDLPLRVRQSVKRLTDPAPTETVLVDQKAWSRQGGGWNEVPKAYTEQLVKQVYDTVIDPPKDESFYACSGKETIDGKEVLRYQAFETIKSPDKDGKQVKNKVVQREGAPIRYVYVSSETGLPVRNTVATADRPTKPFFRADFSYPTDIKIELPPGSSN